MNNVHVIKDKKFKNIYVSIRFLTELKKENVLPILLLSNVLNESCEKYPDKSSVTKVLDNMYGATLSISSSIIGKCQMLIAKSQIIDPSYLKGNDNLLKDLFNLLHDFIYNPLIKNYSFDTNVFEEAKRNVKDSILRSEDDPSTYCMYEAMRKAGDLQPLGDGVFAKVEDLDNVSIEDVMNVYQMILNNAKCNILVLGNVDENEVHTIIKECLMKQIDDVEMDCNYVLTNKLDEKMFCKNKDISQSYITNIYTTKVKNDSKEFAALKVANAILGQLPTSLLFHEIREKHSLCYSIYSALFPYDGALGVSTGVEVGDEQITLELIDVQMDRLKKGDFDDSMIFTAKRMLQNSLRATYDSVDATFGLLYRNILFNKYDDINDLIEEIEEVNKDDIMNVMTKCDLCTSYVLKGEYRE